MGEGARGCGERELCTRRRSLCTSRGGRSRRARPGWGAGSGAGCGAAVGGGRSPQPGEVLEVRGRGRGPEILFGPTGPFSRCPLRRRGRIVGLGLGLHPDPTSSPARSSSAPRARPALRPHKLVSLLCWALLELVPLTPRFCFFLGFNFSGMGVFFLQRAPGFLPQGGLGCPLWQEVRPGAPAWRCMRSGCAVFPRLQEPSAPLPPARPSSQTHRPTTARRRHLQSHPGSGSGARGNRVLTASRQ